MSGVTLTNQIDDALRALGVQGDGRAAETSVGVHEASTNKITNGGFETDVTSGGWTVGANATRTRVTTDFKFGGASLEMGTNTTAGNRYVACTAARASTSNPGTFGVWIRKVGTGHTMSISIKDSTLATTLKTVANPTALYSDANGWGYYVLQATAAELGANTTIAVVVEDTGAAAVTYRIDGVQFEELATPTPYIHTNGATASRSAGRATIPVPTQGGRSLFSTTQGWIAMRLRSRWASGALPSHGFPALFEWADDDNNRLVSWYSGGQWLFRRIAAGNFTNAQVTITATVNWGDVHTVIFAWESGRVRMSIDGAAFVNVSGGPIPTLAKTTLDWLSAPNNGSYQFDGDAFWIATGSGTLADADASTLHGNGNTDPTAFPAVATSVPTWLWTAADSKASLLGEPTDTGVSISDTLARTGLNRSVADTGVSLTETLKRTSVLRNATDTGAAVSDAVTRQIPRGEVDTGLSLSDALARSNVNRTVSDTGVTVTDLQTRKVARNVSDTAATISDTLARPIFNRFASDTGVSFSETLQRNLVARLTADTGVTVSDAVRRTASSGLTDTAISVTDSIWRNNVLRAAGDTGLAFSESLKRTTVGRARSDTGITFSDTIAQANFASKTATDTAVTISDSVVHSVTRKPIDTGVTVTDALARTSVRRSPADTGVSLSDTLLKGSFRLVAISDQGVTVTDSIRPTDPRAAGDTAVTITESLRRVVLRKPTADTGVTVSDAVTKVTFKVVTRTLADIGAAITDVTGVSGGDIGMLIGTDSYEDGTSSFFGLSSSLPVFLSAFTDAFAAYSPPARETEAYYSHLPFVEAERKFGETSPVAGSAHRVSCAWHGLVVDTDRGAVVVVRDGGSLDGLVGQRVRITPTGKPGSNREPVYAYVHAKASLSPEDELSVPRRVFLGLGTLGLDRMPVIVETLK
jgi:hypothetical protein